MAFIFPAAPATADAAVVERSFSIGGAFNSCNNELTFELSGPFIVVSQQQTDNRFRQIATFHGKGFGSDGNEYILNFTNMFVSDNFDFVHSFQEVLITKGSAPNRIVSTTFNSTTGEATFREVCTG
jgi:hypothetical protein